MNLREIKVREKTTKINEEPTSPPPSRTRPKSFYAKLNKKTSFSLEDGSSGHIDLYTMGIGDLSLKIFWSGNNPINLRWRLDGHGLAPSSGNASSEYIAPERHYAFEKNKSPYRLSVEETFRWTSSDADVNGVEVYVTPSN